MTTRMGCTRHILIQAFIWRVTAAIVLETRLEKARVSLNKTAREGPFSVAPTSVKPQLAESAQDKPELDSLPRLLAAAAQKRLEQQRELERQQLLQKQQREERQRAAELQGQQIDDQLTLESQRHKEVQTASTQAEAHTSKVVHRGSRHRGKTKPRLKLSEAAPPFTATAVLADPTAGLGGTGLAKEPRRGRIVVVAVISVVAFVLVVVVSAFLVALWFTGRILKRQASFWWQVGPILLAYRWSIRKMQFYGGMEAEDEERVLEALHNEHAPKALEIVQSLGGMFLKMAQVAANNPMIPLQYRRQFSRCLDHNIPMDFKNVRDEVEAALRAGRPSKLSSRRLEDVFLRFDSEPLGVASIGQVHRATLSKSGREVAIKVKFPDVEQLFMADFASLKVLAGFARCAWAVPLIEEFSKNIAQEFNYEQEAQNVETMSKILLSRFEGKLETPQVCRELTTDSVLTMSFVEGVRLDLALKERLKQAGIDASKLEKAMALGRSPSGFLRDEAASRKSSEDTVVSQAGCAGRIARLSDRSSGLVLDVLLAALRFKTCLDGCFRGMRRGGGALADAPSEVQELLAQADVKAVMNVILDLWGYSILEVGTFHGDPHPGNILVQLGNHIGLLDFGQVKTLPPHVQECFAELILAVADKDHDLIVQKVRELGFELEESEEEIAENAKDGVDTRDPAEVDLANSVFGGAALPGINMRMRVLKALKQAPPELFFVIRCAVILRGVGFGLGQRVNLAKSWRRFAEAYLKALGKLKPKEAPKAVDAQEEEPEQMVEPEQETEPERCSHLADSERPVAAG